MPEAMSLKCYKHMMRTSFIPDCNVFPPKCSCCLYYQPKFRYRRCLYALCPYGKESNCAFRKKPLKKEKIIRRD